MFEWVEGQLTIVIGASRGNSVLRAKANGRWSFNFGEKMWVEGQAAQLWCTVEDNECRQVASNEVSGWPRDSGWSGGKFGEENLMGSSSEVVKEKGKVSVVWWVKIKNKIKTRIQKNKKKVQDLVNQSQTPIRT